jgi:hypothetical protein
VEPWITSGRSRYGLWRMHFFVGTMVGTRPAPTATTELRVYRSTTQPNCGAERSDHRGGLSRSERRKVDSTPSSLARSSTCTREKAEPRWPRVAYLWGKGAVVSTCMHMIVEVVQLATRLVRLGHGRVAQGRQVGPVILVCRAHRHSGRIGYQQ